MGSTYTASLWDASRQLHSSEATDQSKKPERRQKCGRGFKWTPEEFEKIRELVLKNTPTSEASAQFPNRPFGSIQTFMSRVRVEERLKAEEKELPKVHRPNIARRWTAEEDERLRKRVEMYGTGEGAWLIIANEIIDGMRMGRDSLTCKRRWEIISLGARNTGTWTTEETDRLVKAVCRRLRVPDTTLLDSDMLKELTWTEVAKGVQTRTAVQCRSHMYKNVLGGIKGQWTPEEKKLLLKGAEEHGTNWNAIEKLIKTRSAFQIKQKYYNLQRWRQIKEGKLKYSTGHWMPEETELMLKGVEEHGTDWITIQKMIKTRTTTQIKMKYYKMRRATEARSEDSSDDSSSSSGSSSGGGER